MPLLFHQTYNTGVEIGLWRIEEPELWFIEQMNLFPDEEALIATITGHRKLEWLAGRWLLHYMSGRKVRGACLKDEHGKPFLENSKLEISLSHSRELVAVMAGPKAVGIDIQKIVPKITRLSHKFMSEIELASLKPATELTVMHIFWGAKECLYKAYGKRQLDFRANIKIDPFIFSEEGGDLKGEVVKDSFQQSYWLKYKIIDSYVLVYAMETESDTALES